MTAQVELIDLREVQNRKGNAERLATGDDSETDSGVDQRMMGEGVRPQFPDPPAACSECGATIAPGVLKVSTIRFKRPLCLGCQDKQNRNGA